jgi:phage/plasmid-like protein (TIGR03299 family)
MNNLNNDTFNTLENTGTNYTVNKLPLYAMNEKTFESMQTNSFGIFRNDSGAWLGTVGERYTTIQNKDLADIIVKIKNEFGGKIRGGSFKNGAKVYYQNSLPDHVINEHKIKRFITCLNSHDGSGSVSFGASNTVVICDNQFHYMSKELESFRHTSNAETRLRLAVENFKLQLEREKNIINTFDKMNEVNLDKNIVSMVIENMFKVKRDDDIKNISTRKQNQMKTFDNVCAKELKEKGSSLWGLFNAVTHYTNHVQVANSKTDRLSNIIQGAGERLNRQTYTILNNYMIDNKRTSITV